MNITRFGQGSNEGNLFKILHKAQLKTTADSPEKTDQSTKLVHVNVEEDKNNLEDADFGIL